MNIVTISGTSRPGNYTSFAIKVVADALREQQVDVRHFDAAKLELNFPGYPATEDAGRLQAAVGAADAVVLGTPEYHGTYCAMTKLIIENLGFPSLLKDKPLGLVGVASGRIGAIKSLEHLRGVCAHTGAIVLPRAISIAGVKRVFDATGNCTDEATEKALKGLGDNLVKFTRAYVCPRYALESLIRNDDSKPWTAAV